MGDAIQRGSNGRDRLMSPNRCPATLHGERCAYTRHEGPHTFELSNAEAAAAQILDSLTPTELATLQAAWHATGDIQTAMQETLTQREQDESLLR